MNIYVCIYINILLSCMPSGFKVTLINQIITFVTCFSFAYLL